MKRNAPLLTLLVLFVAIAVFFLPSIGQVPQTLIVSPPVPAAVPTLNKTGTGNRFATSSTIPADGCATWVSGDVGSTGSTCGSGGGGGTPGSTLFSSVTTTGPSNSAAETSLVGTVVGSKTIAANTFTDGAVLETRVQGFFSLPAVADALTLKLKCGSTVLASASTTLPAGAVTNGTFRMWLMVTAQGSGAGGSLMTNGLAEFTGSALAPSELKVLNTSAVAFDFTSTCAMDMTAQWGAAQVGESISGTNAAAWIPGAPVISVAGLTGAVPGQGTDSKVLTAGTVSGTAASLCTDANGGATTSGCSSGGGTFGTPYVVSGNTYGPIWQMTPPGLIGAWTWVNQGSATTDGSNNSLSINAPANATQGMKMLVQSAPATPYSVLARMQANVQDQGGSATGRCGVNFRESSTGKIISFIIFSSTGGTMVTNVDKYTNPTTYAGSSYISLQPVPFTTFGNWFKIQDNGTNLIFSMCADNLNAAHCQTYTTQSRTDFMASGPDQIGFFCDPINATYGLTATLLDWTKAP